MDTKAYIENMDMFHSLCEREVKQLHENLNNYLAESAKMRHYINSYCVDKNEARGVNRYILGAYDNYMSDTQIVIDMARKFNLHLQLRNSNNFIDCWQSPQSVLTDYIKWNMYRDQHLKISGLNIKRPIDLEERKETQLLVEQNMKPIMDQDLYKIQSNQSKETRNNSSPVRVAEIKQSVPQIRQRDLSEFVEGYEFLATITYIEDYENLVFFIRQLRDIGISDIKDMYHLPKLVRPPNHSHEIFGVSIQNDEILRAITYLSPKTNLKEKKLLLIDFGEILNLNENFTFYQLPLKYQNIPAQAIKCVLRGVNYIQNDHAHLSTILHQNEFNRCLFRVIDKVDRILNLLIVSKDHSEEEEHIYNCYTSADKTSVNMTNPFLSTSVEEEEEGEAKSPLPEDSIKKNNKIKEEEDDDLLRNTFLEPTPGLVFGRVISFNPPETAFNHRLDPIVNTCIMITVTHIANAACFYAHVIQKQHTVVTMKSNIWTDDKISSSQLLTRAPKLNDLILVKYSKDDCWYRAIVINIYDAVSFKVFYVDYGNSEIVSLNRMAHCFRDNIGEPFQAIRCQLMGIRPSVDNDEVRRKQAVDFLSLILLNETLRVHVVNKFSYILYIRILDENYSELTNNLIKKGYAEKLCEGEYII